MNKEPEVKIMPYLWYNQIQAYNFNLNSTQWIIMNYFSYGLPHFWESKMINGKSYFWANINKPLSDMPTLQIGETTYRKNIRDLIKKGLLDRIIDTEPGNKSRAFYRVTEKWLKQGSWITPSDFNSLYNNIYNNLSKDKYNQIEINKLYNLFSSYKVDKEKETTAIFELDKIRGTSILDYLREEFELSIKWDWVKILTKDKIDLEFVKSKIINVIIDNWIDYWRIKPSVNDSWYEYKGVKYDVNSEVKGKILWNLKKMFQWLKDKKRPIKSWNGVLRTWFWKNYL